MRLGAVRGFARYLHEVDPRVEVPATDLLPDRPRRAVPYRYTDGQIFGLMRATSTLRTPHKAATFRTLFGLLVVTGMRIGEAIALDRSDFDAALGTLIIRRGKFGKSRELPLHPSTTSAVTRYLRRPDRPRQAGPTEALLVSNVGTRLLVSDSQSAFRSLRARAGILPRSQACRPRLHDFRHSFAVRTLLDAYRANGDPAPRVAALSAYPTRTSPHHADVPPRRPRTQRTSTSPHQATEQQTRPLPPARRAPRIPGWTVTMVTVTRSPPERRAPKAAYTSATTAA